MTDRDQQVAKCQRLEALLTRENVARNDVEFQHSDESDSVGRWIDR
jgi:hypothetical protein